MRINLPKQKIPKRKTKILWHGFAWRIFFLFFIFVFSYAGFVVFKLYVLEKKIVEIRSNTASSSKSFIETARDFASADVNKLRGAEEKRINILLLGMGGEGHKGKYLTDTIMMVSVNPETFQSSMFSIPRDLFVQIPDRHVSTKINAIYTYELKNLENSSAEAAESMKKVVQEVTGQEIHYHIILDFDGFKEIIDQLGGIDVEVEHDIYDSRYPGPNYSYETFEIKEGFHHLNAETALKYARVRHTLGGDFGRAKRQQQVLASTRKKAFSVRTLINPFQVGDLLNILGNHLRTDVQISEIPAFLELVKNVNIYQSVNKVLDAWSADSLLASTHVELGGVWAYVLLPRVRNYSEVHALAKNIFELETLKKREEEIEKEEADILVLAEKPGDYYRIQSIFRKFGYPVVIQSELAGFSCPSRDLLVNVTDPAKLFTLDDLVAKLEATVEYQNDVDTVYDMVYCISSDTADYFYGQNQKQEEQKYTDQSIVTEDGKILFK